MPDRKSGPQSAAGGGESADQTLSLREFGRRIGVSEKAVRKARDAGRLENCLTKDGKIAAFERARLAFTSTSRTGKGTRTDGPQQQPQGPQSADVKPVEPTPATPAAASALPPHQPELAEVDEDETSGGIVFAKTLIDAQTLATNERARKLKFENDQTEGRLVPIEAVRKETFEIQRIIRENVLNLVARVGGELHAERDLARFLIKFDGHLRQALNAAADDLVAVNE